MASGWPGLARGLDARRCSGAAGHLVERRGPPVEQKASSAEFQHASPEQKDATAERKAPSAEFGALMCPR